MAQAAPKLVNDPSRPQLAEAPSPLAEEEAKGGGKKKLVLLALLAVAGLAGAFLFLTGGGEASDAPLAPVPGDVVEVAQMTVNLANSDTRYARLSFSVVLAQGVKEGDVSPHYPLLQEAVLREVNSFSAADLRQPGGFDALANALTARARAVYPDGDVLRVVLTELLVQ